MKNTSEPICKWNRWIYYLWQQLCFALGLLLTLHLCVTLPVWPWQGHNSIYCLTEACHSYCIKQQEFCPETVHKMFTFDGKRVQRSCLSPQHEGLRPTWLPPYVPGWAGVTVKLLLIWLAWFKETGVRWSSNVIYGREHVMASCTYSLTCTHVYPRCL